MRYLPLLALSLLPAAATASDNTLVTWQVSPDNIHWDSSLSLHPGQQAWVRALITYTGTPPTLGLAALSFQPTVSNWDATGPSIDEIPFLGPCASGTPPIDIPPYNRTCGVVFDPTDPQQFGRVIPFGRTSLSSTSFLKGHVHINGANGAPQGTHLRIAQAQLTSWFGSTGNTTGGSGIPISQLNDVGRTSADPAFASTTSDIQVFKFAIYLSTDPAQRTLTIDSPAEAFGNRNSTTGERQVYWFNGMTESAGSLRGTPLILPATLTVAPCATADFNNDGDPATDADIEAFFACLAGDCCATCWPLGADFNGDGDSGTDQDIEAFFRVLAGGNC